MNNPLSPQFIEQKKKTCIENLGPGSGTKCGRVKLVNGILTFSSW